jgi:glycosyltransferase involved in cell wall biosynthesis
MVNSTCKDNLAEENTLKAKSMKQPNIGKILYISNTAWYLCNFRLSLMQAMLERGWEVCAAAPLDPYASKLTAQGIRFLETPLRRSSMNPFHELAYLLRLWRSCRQAEPDIVHLFTIKPVIYGSLAARLAGVPGMVNSVPGLGYIFLQNNIIKKLVIFLYKLALQPPAKIIFQNQEDMDLFLKMGLALTNQAYLIRGSGVNCADFNPENLATTEDPEYTTFLLLARMVWDKGIAEFVEAGKKVRAENPATRFILLGGSDSGNPAAVPENWLREQHEQGYITWIGHVDDVRPYLAASSVVVLPSYYKEGLPRALLEAGAMGKPIITTDIPGCRDIVQDGVNGLIVPVKDEQSLTKAMLALSQNKAWRESMGQAGRQRVAEFFDDNIIIQQTIEVYRQTGAFTE